MRIYYRDILLLCLVLLILIYYYISVFLLSMHIFSYILYMLMSYIILVYYILITPIFYYFSRLTIELFFREGCKNNMLEFIYDKSSSEYDIRFVGTFYYFRLDKLYSEYIYNIYQRDMFTEKVNIIESLINKCDRIYDFHSHLKYERRYYIEIYYSILLLGILFFLIFFLS